MSTGKLDKFCSRACWTFAATAGVIVLLVLWAGFGTSFGAGLVWGVVVAILVGLALANWLCGRMNVGIGGSAGKAAARAPAPAAPAAAPAPAPAAAAAPVAPAAPAAAAPAAPAAAASTPAPSATPAEPEAGTRPAALAAPDGGKADDLKRIKGIGPKLETLCHSLGIYHFSQIAGWGAAEVAWMDQNLEGFRGRVSRDTWVEQAKVLAQGGETAFSTKVDKGGVY